ncbi:major facilitator superfamily domain-containing protein [Bisporella sp. PMI_857]|nr:major facilitator superfamily domain-containing protein [Bisporella sp. PMI_857]
MALHDDEVDATEATPLIPQKPKKAGGSVLYRLLLTGFMVSLSFAVTQVPLIYVFRVMTCEAYYENHPEPLPGSDRCGNREIEADTARAVALLGTSTTFFGVINLFITGWNIKRFGVKAGLLIQVFFPAVRLAIQNIGVMTGSNAGIVIIQCSQIVTILGGPGGYLLALNSFVAEVIEHRERTGALGRLQGMSFIGNSLGYLVGGFIGEYFGILAPFRLTLALFLTCCIYIALFLPWVAPYKSEAASTAAKGLARFFGPLKTFTPQKWVLRNGTIQREYGALILGLGVFFGVLATGYIPVLLQLYSTDALGFGTRENGLLISLNSFIRGLFLTFVFPKIISAGRSWISSRSSQPPSPMLSKNSAIPDLPHSPAEFAGTDDEPIEPPKLDDEKETFEFDLHFTKYSLIVDGALTGAATFVTKGWQIYLVAIVLPLASGTGSSAKGTILQMFPASERADALSAITLLDMIARLSTTLVFGIIYAAFAEIGQTQLVFVVNAGIAVLGFCILLFSRFPPEGSKRLGDEQAEATSQDN